MIGWIGGAFAAGLFGSAHCIGMCGGFATACTGRRGGVTAWHVGRLVTYATLGAVAGTVGGAVPGPAWLASALAALLLVVFAGKLAGVLPELAVPIPGVRRAAGWLIGRRDLPSSIAFGGVSGLVPCGLVYAALGVPVALRDPALGAAAMVAFGLGTVPALTFAAAGLARLGGLGRWPRRAVAALVLAAGLGSLGMRHAPAAIGAEAGEAPSCH